ncbi:MAG: hypothetical protein QOD39_3307 [Mycobacterium sp.]|nr:hypothetical protein [Mycobacterium sp.]
MTTTECPPLPVRITKSLLGYGVIAGPIYVVVAAAQMFTRDGYDPTRHAVSQLANGDLGWIQIANFLITGAMTIAAAVGVRRALGPGGLSAWASGLLGAYGAGVVVAAIFRADPSDGFPPGTPPGMGEVSWHGMAHFAVGGLGFACLVAACFVLGTWFARRGEAPWAGSRESPGSSLRAASSGWHPAPAWAPRFWCSRRRSCWFGRGWPRCRRSPTAASDEPDARVCGRDGKRWLAGRRPA